ncbi:MAG TPA: hypothetical protein VI389_03290 [Geobacteraceae bacterium]
MAGDSTSTREITCQQVLREDASVYSAQWMTISPRHADAVSPPLLLERYLAHVRRFTLSLVRPVQSESGLAFRFLGSHVSLISFAPPEYAESGTLRSLDLHINGGVLVQPGECDRGKLSFMADRHEDGVTVTIRLSDYCPLLLGSATPGRWRKLLYRLTQAFIHKVVTVRFLARLFRELEGPTAPVRVVRVKSATGEDI